MSNVYWNRFDSVATAAGSGVDVQTITQLASTPEDEFGDEEGDYPRAAGREPETIGTPTLEQTIAEYDLNRPENITILNPENPET